MRRPWLSRPCWHIRCGWSRADHVRARGSREISMKARSLLGTALALTAAAVVAWQAQAGRELVAFPENFADGVRYATVTRGNIKEDIFTSRDAIDAAKAGKKLPSSTVIKLVDYRDGKLFRYVVME